MYLYRKWRNDHIRYRERRSDDIMGFIPLTTGL
jgi:hypothetical protein